MKGAINGPEPDGSPPLSKILKLYPRKGRQLAFAFGLRDRLLKTLHRTARIALSGLMAVAVITACDNGDIPAPTLEPTASPAQEPTPTPIRTARPGAAGLDDPLYPGLGNGGYDVARYTVTLEIDVDANEISGRTQIEADATQDLSSFNLDFRGLTVTQVAVDGLPADHSRTGYELTIEPGAPIPVGTTFNATVSYEGQPSTSSVPGTSLLVGWINYETGIIAYGEPWGRPIGSRSMSIHPIKPCTPSSSRRPSPMKRPQTVN